MTDAQTVEEQQTAPDFTLPAISSAEIVKDGKIMLGALCGKLVVFYPKTILLAVLQKRNHSEALSGVLSEPSGSSPSSV